MAGDKQVKSGAMPLTDHLRELRSRLLKAGIAIALGMVVGWIYYPQLFGWLSAPFESVVAQARANGQTVILALTGVADPFVLQMQVAAVAGIILSSPIWLYQLWRFVTPGLRRNEKYWALGFVAVATPLFAAGVMLAYTVLPYGMQILFGFTPAGVENIVSVDRYLSFFIRTILVFRGGVPRAANDRAPQLRRSANRCSPAVLVALDYFYRLHICSGGHSNRGSNQPAPARRANFGSCYYRDSRQSCQ